MDIPELDTLVLASPKTDVVQSFGRITRFRADADNHHHNNPLVIDVVDTFAVVARFPSPANAGSIVYRDKDNAKNCFTFNAKETACSKDAIAQPINVEDFKGGVAPVTDACIFENNHFDDQNSFEQFMSKNIRYDVTLPRAHNIPCPTCSSNNNDDDGGSSSVLFIKYDAGLKFLYFCERCDTFWKTGVGRSVAKDSPKDAAADSPKDAAADSPKDSAADSPRDAAADSPRDAAADSPRDAAADSPKDAATDSPRDAAADSPKDAAADSPKDVVPGVDESIVVGETKSVSNRETTNHVNARALMDMDPDTPNESTLGDTAVAGLFPALVEAVLSSSGVFVEAVNGWWVLDVVGRKHVWGYMINVPEKVPSYRHFVKNTSDALCDLIRVPSRGGRSVLWFDVNASNNRYLGILEGLYSNATAFKTLDCLKKTPRVWTRFTDLNIVLAVGRVDAVQSRETVAFSDFPLLWEPIFSYYNVVLPVARKYLERLQNDAADDDVLPPLIMFRSQNPSSGFLTTISFGDLVAGDVVETNTFTFTTYSSHTQSIVLSKSYDMEVVYVVPTSLLPERFILSKASQSMGKIKSVSP
eukprot:gene3640-biopygen21379